MNERIQRAVAKAHQDAQQLPTQTTVRATKPSRRLAVGDPQAPLETFLEILDAHGVLGDDGRLAGDVQLVSMGDHFDWGTPDDRERATREGVALLSWLAAHPRDQVVILVGNHDLSRVSELSFLRDDAAFEAARRRADTLYRRATPAPRSEQAAFAAEYPFVHNAEALSRDLSTFSVAQRRLVQTLLEAHRVCLAYPAAPDLLLVHGAVTVDDLQLLGVPADQLGDAELIARALNGFLERVLESWDGKEPLDLEPVHRSQSAKGEGRGILYQRPAHPDSAVASELAGPPRRRYDPRRLPTRLTQAVGHVRDSKCRELLGAWVQGPAPAHEGALRSLVTDGEKVRYAAGVATRGEDEAAVLFLDGGMNWAAPDRYELLDLETRSPAVRRRS